MANPAWVSHTAVVVPLRLRSGTSVIVLSRNGIVRWAPPVYICSSGSRATCSGIASSDTVTMNSGLRPLKSIQAKP